MIPEKKRFLIYALGIFFCYFLYGIVQEKITRGRYGQQANEDGTVGERFTYALALVWVQCFCNFIFAKGLLIAKPQKEDTTHSGYYAVSALTYLLAMVSSNMALRWVPYPTQVVGKSAKPIPVMILGVLIGRKSYSWIRYGCVVTIVLGVILFMYKEGQANPALANENTGLGEILLILSLSMDGLLGAVQERMRSSSAPSGHQMMFSMNFWSSLMLGFAMIVTGEGKDFVHFASRHPELWSHLIMLAFCGVLGQLFIFLMVADFGPLSCSVVTTTRKFFTVLCSVLIFGNILMPRQWFGAVLVFVGLFADMFYGKKSSPPKKPVAAKDKDSEISLANHPIPQNELVSIGDLHYNVKLNLDGDRKWKRHTDQMRKVDVESNAPLPQHRDPDPDLNVEKPNDAMTQGIPQAVLPRSEATQADDNVSVLERETESEIVPESAEDAELRRSQRERKKPVQFLE